MNKNIFLTSLIYCIQELYNSNVIAYPTEAMFGLGCDPDNKKAVKKLLKLKKRSIKKGLILVASHYNQIKNYINENSLSIKKKKDMLMQWPGPVTFLVPASISAPHWLTGHFNTVAVRISNHFSIIKLCNIFGKALISTSANFSNMPPCLTTEDICRIFGKKFPLLNGKIGSEKNPSTIINIINGKFIRHANI
ncbi:L-threonylcarbamoyladenylate synthase type 1 TsaC [Buchnera aphidicola (Melanaphis sacchari)]|uniref:Threonylcarbamoyl-AMP synthase n=2 Tax=Buchnera aphidicola TaxID=9 RepID=A0A2U8DFM0_9GAMM|nr:L-threonylcarbamoyladenylate synthase type 1 TsaC [Buchnera aphidicola (Melanaphis sacchari)]